MHAGVCLLFPSADVCTTESEEWDYNLELNLNSESTKSYISFETLEAIVKQLLMYYWDVFTEALISGLRDLCGRRLGKILRARSDG